jgi:alpha-1,3-mannosyltransferase
MRITHVVRQFHPAVGGLETVVLELASAQIRAGHSVRVVTLDRIFNSPDKTRLSARDSIHGIDVVRIPFFGSTRYPIAPSVIKHLGKADIVHVHGIDFFFDYLAWTKLVHRKPLVASTHGGFFHTDYMAGLKRLYFSTITRLSSTFYAAIIAVSPSDEKLFSSIRHRGIICIENGVDVQKYADAASKLPRKTILSHGRLATNKRLDRVISLVATLRQTNGDWTLKIAGRPWDVSVKELARLCDDAGLRDAVEVVLSPSDEALRTIMAQCSLAMSASDYEGFGLSAIEAMSAGLLPVLSAIPPYQHLAAGTGAGIIVDFDDPKTAAKQLLQAWHSFSADYDRSRLTTMNAVTRYDWQHAADAYAKMYSKVLGQGHRTILDVLVRVSSLSQAVDFLDRTFERGQLSIVAFANAHSLNIAATDRRYRSALEAAIVFNDGAGLNIASRLLFGSPFPENLNGTDFMPRYMVETTHRYRIFLLGSRPEIVKRAAAEFARLYPRHDIVGYRDGYFESGENASIIQNIRQSAADIVLVAIGNPKQEIWLADNLAVTGCKLGFGVGALFDFMSGEVPRAPLWVQRSGLEWLYRLYNEPRRLWNRYVYGNPRFLLRVIAQWSLGARI